MDPAAAPSGSSPPAGAGRCRDTEKFTTDRSKYIALGRIATAVGFAARNQPSAFWIQQALHNIVYMCLLFISDSSKCHPALNKHMNMIVGVG